MAVEMRRLGLLPDLVLVSSARRTLQTLAALEPWDKPPAIEPLDALYLASADDILETIQGAAATVRSVMVVGHNPGLHDLALLLAGPDAGGNKQVQRLAEGYPSGALTEFTVDAPWSGLHAGSAKLVRFLLPSGLSEVNV